MMDRREQHGDYFYGFEELSGAQRQLRMRQLAGLLDVAVRKSGGVANRKVALTTLASHLGTSEVEISRGIVLGEGLRLFERTPDGLALRSP